MNRFEEPFPSGPLLECDSRGPLLTCDSLRSSRAVSVAAHLSDALNDKAAYIGRMCKIILRKYVDLKIM